MKQKVMSALYMGNYGIMTAVLTNHEKFDLYMDGYEEDGLGRWPEMHKRYVFGQVKALLLKEDAYFNQHLDEAVISNKRWAKFCDDCIELATLDQYLFGNPICLLHPDSYMNGMIGNPRDLEWMKGPDLVEGIPVQRRDH